nr:NAD-dependent epimerase/dehydratase family protein [uncultured Flavobacterium sp.]
MNKIYITGVTGFVGLNLVSYFKKYSKEVVGVSRSRNDLTQTIDYSDFYSNDKTGALAVIHLAGKAHDLRNAIDVDSYFKINYELTKKVYDTFLSSKIDVFIYMSSVKAVRDVVDGVLTENEIPSPVTAYGQSKLKAEEYILSNLPENKRVYILRPCMIHGPGNKGNLNLLYRLVSKGIPWPLGDFDNKRSFLSIENLCFVIKELLDRNDISSGVYQVADDLPLSTNTVIELMGDSLGKKRRIWNLPREVVTIMARLGNHLKLPLNTERLQKLTENYEVSNVKIVKAMQKKLPVSSKDGLYLTFKSFT